MKHYYVYIMTNWNNKVLYIGVTNNIERKVEQHKLKIIEGFTKKYNVNKLVYFSNFSYIKDAIEAEKRLKGWKRVKKINLITAFNPEWKDLSNKINLNEILYGSKKDSSVKTSE